MFRQWIWWRLFQILLDALGVYAAFLIAYFVRVGWIFSTDFPFLTFALLALAGTAVWIGFLVFTKYYRLPPRSGFRAWFEDALALTGGVVAVGFLIVSYFFPREILFSRLIGVYIFVFANLWLWFSRIIFREILSRQKKRSKNVYKTLIIGANRVAEKLVSKIQNDRFAPYKIVGVIDPYGLAKNFSGTQILGKLDKLEKVCADEKISAIVQCDAFEHTLNLISFCDEKKIKFQFDPALRGIFEENLRIREVAGQTMISFVQRDFSGVRKIKFRLVDWALRQIFDVD